MIITLSILLGLSLLVNALAYREAKQVRVAVITFAAALERCAGYLTEREKLDILKRVKGDLHKFTDSNRKTIDRVVLILNKRFTNPKKDA